jgi:Holliday junction DNA helicase RuvA
MISMLRGRVQQLSQTQAVVMVGGVGYLVNVPMGTQFREDQEGEVTLHTMLIVRQDGMDLYGFADQRQREIFSLLLNVTGIGPKTAVNILSQVDPNRFLDEVVCENIVYLTSLPGIGTKSAQRIVIELKERIARHYGPRGGRSGAGIASDAVAALMALGYTEPQALKAVASVKADTVEDLVRRALKELV